MNRLHGNDIDNRLLYKGARYVFRTHYVHNRSNLKSMTKHLLMVYMTWK